MQSTCRQGERSPDLAGRPIQLAWHWPLFTVDPVQRGYSDDAIGKILGGNVLRVARAVWESRA